jgi:hypothetical protein
LAEATRTGLRQVRLPGMVEQTDERATTMTDLRDESRTTTTPGGTNAAGSTPPVQVYDTTGTTTRTDTTVGQPGTNWGTIILAILIVLVVLALIWWFLF